MSMQWAKLAGTDLWRKRRTLAGTTWRRSGTDCACAARRRRRRPNSAVGRCSGPRSRDARPPRSPGSRGPPSRTCRPASGRTAQTGCRCARWATDSWRWSARTRSIRRSTLLHRHNNVNRHSLHALLPHSSITTPCSWKKNPSGTGHNYDTAIRLWFDRRSTPIGLQFDRAAIIILRYVLPVLGCCTTA